MNVDTGPKHSAVPQEKSIPSYKKQVSIDDMITKNKPVSREGEKEKNTEEDGNKFLLADFEKMIKTHAPVATTKSISKLDPSHEKYRKYLQMSDYGEVFLLPNEDEKILLKSVQNELRAHTSDTKNHLLEDFFEKAVILQKQIESIHPKLYAIYSSLRDATDAYHDCTIAKSHCRRNENYETGVKWQIIQNALKATGIDTYLRGLTEERRLHKKEAKEAAMKKRQEEKERSNNNQPTSSSISATAPSSDTAEVDSNEMKDDVITIDGDTVLIGDIAKPGIDHDRARKRKLREVSPALPSSTQTHRSRTAAPV